MAEGRGADLRCRWQRRRGRLDSRHAGPRASARTFFLTGRWTAQFPTLAREIAAHHFVGNHSQTHAHFRSLTPAEQQAEILRAQDTIRVVTGHDPRPLFRFPYGDRDVAAIELANNLGYLCFRWSVDTLGWKGLSGGMTAAKVAARVVSQVRRGAIILMHVSSHPDDGTTFDASALPVMIERLGDLGYRFVTLHEAIKH